MLIGRNLVIEAGGKTILDGASLQVPRGEKVGLVGRNGAGKTTLLRVLGGADAPRTGMIDRPAATGYLSQDPRGEAVPDDITGLVHVLSGRGLDRLQNEMEKARIDVDEDPSPANLERFSQAQDRFEREQGYAADAEIRRLAAGIGLRDDRLDLSLGALSGGERRRLELVRILFSGSDLLLLDEPTNHLDLAARTWLLGFLRSYPGALVVVSHDLDLLDDAITRVVHVDRESEEGAGTLVEYRGTYTMYLAARERDEVGQAKRAARQQIEIARFKKLADSMRGQTAKRARVARNFDRRVERLRAEQVVAPTRRRKLNLRFPTPPPCGRTVLTASELWKSFGRLDVFADVGFDVGRGERLLVTGRNGAGKTTLLKVLEGRLEPDLGKVELGTRASIGYYAQEHEGISPGRSLIEHMRDVSPIEDGALRALLGMFGLGGPKAFQDAVTLSGGEKTKLALAQLVAGKHNVLLLDEPTNNLDPMSRRATGEALAGWPGTMIVVSHDVEFVRALDPDRALLMPDGVLDCYDDEMLELVALT